MKWSKLGGLITSHISSLFAPLYRSLYFPPAVILTAVLIATLFGWQSAQAALDQDIAAEASLRADAGEQSLREHMLVYEQILRGGAGLFQSSNEVTLDEWESFLSALNVNRGFAGVQSVGFVKVFPGSELPTVAEFMATQGVKNFHITPPSKPSNTFASILYAHYIDAQDDPHYGYNMYSDPVLRTTMRHVRDSGSLTMTPGIKLLSDHSGERYFGFKLFAPYYGGRVAPQSVAERRAALSGYIYASFRSASFFPAVLGSPNNQQAGFFVKARNGASAQTMYESPTYTDVGHLAQAKHIERQVSLYGQTWTIHFAADPATLVSDEQLARPSAILFFGVFSAGLVSLIVLLLIRARAHDLSMQKERAVELAKDELLSLASHQLRTPATGVKQYVGMVLQGFAGKIPASQRKLLEKAYASNDRQLRIINEILHLAKIDAGRIVLAKQPTDLGELVSDVTNEQRPDIETAHHQLKLSLPKKPLMIQVDTHMLRMAIENLLSNAIKYTHSGGRIHVQVYSDSQNAFIAVADTGIGIHPGDTDKIFKQFSRLSNTMSQRVGGTGIGLYLAKNLVELHHGSITVVSAPGEGSTFTIALPLELKTEAKL